jgi:hypothetical protein
MFYLSYLGSRLTMRDGRLSEPAMSYIESS